MISAFAIKNNDVVNVGVYLNLCLVPDDLYHNDVDGVFNKMISKEGVISLVYADVGFTNCVIYNDDLYKDIPEDGLNKEYVYTKIVPRIKDSFRKNGKMGQYGSACINLLIIYKDKMFFINSAFNVFEIEDCFFLGNAAEPGSFVYQCDKIDISDKVKVFNKIASEYLENKSSPLMVTDSRELNFKEWRG